MNNPILNVLRSQRNTALDAAANATADLHASKELIGQLAHLLRSAALGEPGFMDALKAHPIYADLDIPEKPADPKVDPNNLADALESMPAEEPKA